MAAAPNMVAVSGSCMRGHACARPRGRPRQGPQRYHRQGSRAIGTWSETRLQAGLRLRQPESRRPGPSYPRSFLLVLIRGHTVDGVDLHTVANEAQRPGARVGAARTHPVRKLEDRLELSRDPRSNAARALRDLDPHQAPMGFRQRVGEPVDEPLSGRQLGPERLPEGALEAID